MPVVAFDKNPRAGLVEEGCTVPISAADDDSDRCCCRSTAGLRRFAVIP